jgi:drug/metabolite transporter (DMT)-like permease
MTKMEGKLLGLILLSIILVERTESFSIPTAVGRLQKYSAQSRCQLLSTVSEKWLYKRWSTIVKSSEIDSDEENVFSDRARGLLVLMTVPIAWGTYVPVVRYLYEIQPPVPGFVFSAAYYVVASLTLIGLVSANVGEPAVPQHFDEDAKQIGTIVTTASLPILGGLELGTYLFLGNGFQILGLKTVPSDRAGFLVQLTTVMVPFVSGVLDGNLQAITAKTWIACLLAFAGVIVMGVDGSDDISTLSSLLGNISEGDLFIVMAAFVYTLHVVRLGTYARGTTPFKLGACKATFEAILSISLVVFLVSVGGASTATGQLLYAQEAGRDILTFFSTISENVASGAIPTSVLLPALGATLWTGWITCAYTISAQSFGQSRLGPTEANLIYSMQPLFTALFAWCLLGETLGPAGAVGGGLIASAVYLVASNVREERET